MRKVVLVFREQHNQSYVGGVLTIIRAYLAHSAEFKKNGIEISSFFFEPPDWWNRVNSKMRNVAYIFQQRSALSVFLQKKQGVILNIHTSREFLFLKDVMLAAFAKKKCGVKSVLTIHVGDINTVFNRIEFARRPLISCMNKYVDKTVFLSNQIRDQFISAGLDQNRCEVLYNFHDMVTVSENEIIPRNAKLQLLFVGAIHREKGIIELLSALCNAKDIDFHIDVCGQITDKTIESHFNELVEQLGDRLTMHGYVSGVTKAALFERADILVLPSYHEGMPLVVLEGLSRGCAIITTKVGAIPEILSSNNAIWVEKQSTKDIEAAIRKLDKSPEALMRMQDDNRQLGKQFSVEEHVKMLSNIYKEL